MTNTEQLTDFLLATMKETKSFVSEQAPDVAKEMLSYGVFAAERDIVLGLMLLTIAFGMFFMALNAEAYSDRKLWGSIAGSVSLVLGLICIPCGYSKLKQIELAPKVYIIEQLTRK